MRACAGVCPVMTSGLRTEVSGGAQSAGTFWCILEAGSDRWVSGYCLILSDPELLVARRCKGSP